MMTLETQEMDRRIANTIAMGVIEEVDYANPPRARVRIGQVLTGWLRMGMARAGRNTDWSVFEIGEEVLVAAPSGDLRNAVVVCALNNGVHPARAGSADIRRIDFGDGTSVVHERSSGQLSLKTSGDITIVSGGAVNITAPGNVTVNGDMKVNGTITASNDVSAKGISLTTHIHSGVSSGTAKTGGPQ